MFEIIHQAYWLLKQLNKRYALAEYYINVRAIHNKQPYTDGEGKKQALTEVTFNELIPVCEMKSKWNDGLFARLLKLNSGPSPSNIYFGVNPRSSQGHKKENCAFFTCFYLDLDDSKSYTKEQRWLQIQFWIALGFAPSLVVDSGHGYHVYWILKSPVSREEGEIILKRMVALSGCKEGGNTFDISRILRLPGFLNVKEWYSDDKPACGLVYVNDGVGGNVAEHYESVEEAPCFDVEMFKTFPPSELKNLQQYYEEAQKLAVDGKEFNTAVNEVLAVARKAQTTLAMHQNVEHIVAENAMDAPPAGQAWEPTLNVIPMVDEIKWDRNRRWMKKYCILGHSGLGQGELDELKIKFNISDVSASNLDFHVIYFLVKTGYTKDAVREFWKRPDVKLYREDKEQKNANYFDMTFANALARVQASKSQTKTGSTEDPDIWEQHHQTWHRDKKGNIESILSFSLKLNALYIDEDALQPEMRQWYDVTATCLDPVATDGVSTFNLFVPNAAFNNIGDCKEYFSNDLMRVMTNSNAILQRIAFHLVSKYRNVERYSFHSMVVYKNEKFVYPTFDVTKGSIIRRDSLPMTDALKHNFPMFGNFGVRFEPWDMTLKQLKDHWGSVLTMHLPTLICSIIGSIAATAIKPMFEEQLNVEKFHLPTINIRGASHTAKTETVRHLCTITGVKSGKNAVGMNSSEFSMARYLSMTNFIPIIIDEFKDDGENRKEMTRVRRLIRALYSGETIMRGRQNLSVAHLPMHGNLIVVGETALERLGDVSEMTRVMPVNTDLFNATVNYMRWSKLQNIYWYELAPLFSQWLLNQNIQARYNEFEALKIDVIKMLEADFGSERLRVGHNLAALWFGCRLYDQFILSLDPSLPTIEKLCNPQQALVGTLCRLMRDHGQTMTAKTVEFDPTTKTEVTRTVNISLNELTSTIRTFGEMVETRDKAILDLNKAYSLVYGIDKAKDELYLNVISMSGAVREFCLRTGRQQPPTDQKLKALAGAALAVSQPWIKSYLGVRHRYRGNQYRVMVLKLSTCVEMGLWPTTYSTPPEDQESQIYDFPDEIKTL